MTDTYRLIHVDIAEGSRLPHCDHCGHGIRVQCHIQHIETGQVMIVGSDCVRQFVGVDDSKRAGQIQKRYERAARQWRTGKPAPREDETRDEYMARRVDEMGNALPASHEFFRWYAKEIHTRCLRINERARRIYGIPRDNNPYYSPFDSKIITEHAIARIERKHRANRFDFTKTQWQVRDL